MNGLGVKVRIYVGPVNPAESAMLIALAGIPVTCVGTMHVHCILPWIMTVDDRRRWSFDGSLFNYGSTYATLYDAEKRMVPQLAWMFHPNNVEFIGAPRSLASLVTP